jgi:AraC-like DNA-binding protein
MDLLPILQELGIERLHEGHKEISGCCPAHKRITGHADGHPSWSISKTTGAHICYSCGWKGGLVTLYQEVTGQVPDDLMREMTYAGLVRAQVEEEEELEPDWNWEYELSVSVPVPQQLREYRHLKAEALAHYDVWWNKERACWMLPFTTINGTVYGAQYRAHGSELNLPVGVETKASLFGMDKFWNERQITLVESPLDAVRLFQVGVPAVAAYGAWVSKDQVELLCRHFRTVIIAMDADKAGLDSTERLIRSFRSRHQPYYKFAYATADPASEDYVKDPGDYTTDEELLTRWKESFNLFRYVHTNGTALRSPSTGATSSSH